MKAFLNDKLDRLGADKFYIIGPLTSLLSDVILIYYITAIFLPNQLPDEEFIRTFRVMFQKMNQTAMVVPRDFILQQKALLLSIFPIVFYGFFLFHCVIAYNVYKKSSGSIAYLKVYTGSAVGLSVLELLMYIIAYQTFNFYTFFTMILYGLVFYGLKHFEKLEPQT